MTVVEIPVACYSIREQKGNSRYGATSVLPLQAARMRAECMFSLASIPAEATITSAIFKVYLARDEVGETSVNLYELTEPWTSSVTWNNQPYATAERAIYFTDPPQFTVYAFEVTAYVATRPQHGFMISTREGAKRRFIYGSTNGSYQPVLEVTYTEGALTPSNLTPDGGAVSVPKPTLTYAGDPEMTAQRIEARKGATTFDSGWVLATQGLYVPPAGYPAADGGVPVEWRASVRTPEGDSDASPWASYTYAALPTADIINPGATSPDGTPTLQWTASEQSQWGAFLYEGSRLIEWSGWRNEPLTRDWMPSKGVSVPGGNGNFVLLIRDDTLRVAATGAPTEARVEQAFETVLDGSGAGVSNLAVTWDDPTPVLTGDRPEGIPDEVSVIRDGKQVLLWDPADWSVGPRMPGAVFFTGTAFEIPDYTANARTSHDWQVIAWTNGVPSFVNPIVTAKFTTPEVWLINPRTGVKVSIQGIGGEPAVDQEVEEAAVVHTPITGGPVVESVRRRLVRSTRFGSVVGTVQNGAEEILDEWSASPPGSKYRLVFGKVNWSVIIGDYSPTDVFYPSGDNGPSRLAISFNWWERLSDI